MRSRLILFLILLFFVNPSANAGYIETLSPLQNSITALPDTDISIKFTEDMMAGSINDSSILVHSRYSGWKPCIVSYNTILRTATLDPVSDFFVGDIVTVVITNEVTNSHGSSIDSAFVYSYTVRTLGGNGTFISDSSYSSPDGPAAVVSTDIDSDGDLDIICGATSSNSFQILKGKADGQFSIDSNITLAGVLVSDVFAADFNSDSFMDFAFSHSFSNGFSVVMNIGGTDFDDPVFISAGDYPLAISGSDFDGDGDIDIAVANTHDNDVGIYLNDGTGVFTYAADYATGQEPWGICTGDFDSDGDMDIATANDVSLDVSILFNDGAAAFGVVSNSPVGYKPISIYPADFDSDYDLDLVVVADNTDNAILLINDSVGGFSVLASYPVQETPASVTAADLDGDFDLDIVAVNRNSNTISVRFNSGADFTEHQVIYIDQAPESVAIGDFDNDDDLDMAAANKISNTIAVLLNNLVCYDTDGDGYGDPMHPENQCDEDNCPYTFNPYQEDSDGDGTGDSCDTCIDHPLDDCCNPRWGNNSPEFTSALTDTANPGEVFEYVIEYQDPDCDGDELIPTLLDYPDWCEALGDTIRGTVECGAPDDAIRVSISDGSTSILGTVNVIVNNWNQPPAILDTVTEQAVEILKGYSFLPEFEDIDDSILDLEYIQLPGWLTKDGDSVYGTSPEIKSTDTLSISVSDVCHADTLDIVIRVFVCGDSDSSGFVDVDDIVFILVYLFQGGPAPVPIESSNADCRIYTDIDDLVYIIEYLFRGGPDPCSNCD